MKILEKLLAGLAAVGAVFSAIFYVLFKQKKDENEKLTENINRLSEENNSNHKITEALQTSHQEGINEQKENEELIQAAHGADNLSSFNACVELLSK